jgi:hypothetical protein
VTGAIEVTVGRPSLVTGAVPKTCDFTPTRTSKGNFTINTTNCVPGYDAIGGDEAVVGWGSPGGDVERLFVRAPFVEALPGRAIVDGNLDQGTSSSLELRSNAGQVRGVANVTASSLTGIFSGTFRRNGTGVATNVGDHILGTWDGTNNYQVRSLTMAISPSQISGTCDPSTAYGLAKFRNGKPFDSEEGTTDGTGATGPLDISDTGLQSGDLIRFTCMAAGGDRTTVTRLVS